MPPELTGQFTVEDLADGTRAFRLRFRALGQRHREVLHERHGCGCGCGGGWDERAARADLGNVLARVRAGVWEPRERPAPAEPVTDSAMPTFREYASAWLAGKRQGVLGDKPIDANTEADYRWRLSRHLLPYFAAHPLDQIAAELCLAFKSHKLQEATEIRDALAAGADLRDRHGRRLRPLSASSIRKLIDTLAAILDDALEDELIDRNPARGKRMRVRVPKPARTFLEMDELAAVIEAAGDQDGSPAIAVPIHGSASRRNVARLAAAGRRPSDIAAELRLAKATVTHHLRALGVSGAEPHAGRRAIVETLGRSGVRVSELCDLRVGELRLHDRDNGRFGIPDAKTEAGIREVQMSPDLVDRLTEHVARLRAAGQPSGPEACAFPNLRGGRISRQRVGKILREAALAASAPAGARTAAASDHDAAHAAAHLHLDRAARQRLRRQVGHEPGRPRRFEDDARRLRPARAARRALSRHLVRRSPPRRERPAAGS